MGQVCEQPFLQIRIQHGHRSAWRMTHSPVVSPKAQAPDGKVCISRHPRLLQTVHPLPHFHHQISRAKSWQRRRSVLEPPQLWSSGQSDPVAVWIRPSWVRTTICMIIYNIHFCEWYLGVCVTPCVPDLHLLWSLASVRVCCFRNSAPIASLKT